MGESTTGGVIFLSLTVVCAVVAHALIRRPTKAATAAAVTGTLLFQVAASLHLGYVDPFAPIAIVFGGLVAFPIAVLVPCSSA